MHYLKSVLLLIFLFLLNLSQASQDFDKKRPQGTTDEQWHSLKAAVQETVLLPENSYQSQESYFGNSVAIDGNIAIIGAPGITGSSATGTGAAHILEYDGTKWHNAYLLLADDAEIGDRFGQSVSISGDWAVVGANADDLDNRLDQGSVYIFKRTNTNGQVRWNQYDKLSNGNPGDFFGYSVSVYSTNGLGRLVIGAPKNDEIEANAGKIYIFELDASDWTQVNQFTAPDANQSDEFGASVSLYNNLIVVGADGNDDDGSFSGSAYIYKTHPVTLEWEYKTKLLADDAAAGDRFGFSVSAGFNRVLIGAYADDNGANQNVGSAYVFDEVAGIWNLTFKLEATDQQAFDLFGRSVSLSGDRALISAPFSDDSGSAAGSTYIFELDNGTWSESQKIVASDASSADEFGIAVALDGDNFIAGAPKDDFELSNSGSVYGFNYDGMNWLENSKLYEVLNINQLNFAYDVSLNENRALIGTRSSSSMYETSGAAYIFDYVNGNWEYTATLMSDDGQADDLFGVSVSLLGNRALIGASGVEPVGSNIGAAYIFELQSGSWIQTAKLTPGQVSSFTLFGKDVVLGQDRALISTSKEYVSVFDFDGNTWNETVLNHDQGSALIDFGASIDLDDDRILVGASRLNNGLGTESGGAYVFDFDGSWTLASVLRADDTSTGDRFGFDVSLDGSSVIIGAYQNDDNGNNSGSAYIFENNNNTWSQTSKLLASDGEEADGFGRNVSIDNDRALISGGDKVYVFDKGINLWTETEIISHPEFDLGRSLDLKGNRALLGSLFGGNDLLSGSAYIYQVDPVYVVSGTISGLVNSIEIQNMGADNLILSENGVFEYPNFEMGDEYLISILNQPQSPAQNCSITNAGGFVFSENITNIQINCVSTEFQLGVNVSGLAENSSVQFSNNLITLDVTDNGISQFDGFYETGFSYNIVTTIEPSMPNQICTVSNGSGSVSNSNVVLNVECVTVQYQIGVTVTNLADGNSITLQNNGENLIVSDENTAYFETNYDDLSHYEVSIITQPSTPNQTCNIVDPVGQINGENVNLTIDCSYEQHRLSVIVTGLASGNFVRLINNNEIIDIDDSLESFFSGTFDDGSGYNVTVYEQPTDPNQLCTVINSMGNFAGENVTLNVNCVIRGYQLGLNVSGLANNNSFTASSGSESIEVNNNGTAYFQDLFEDSIPYFIEVIIQPTSPNQNCHIANPGGIINGADVILAVICTTDTFFVGGSVTNLAQGNSLNLTINTSSESLNVNGSTFFFPTPLEDSTNYLVSIANQPTNPVQNCTLNNPSGTINAADVTNIEIVCNEVDYFVGVTVNGLTDNNFMTLRNNVSDNLSVRYSGTYVFYDALADSDSYEVIILTQPSSPIQNCTVSNGSGIINTQDIDDVVVDCDPSEEVIFKQGFE